MGAVYMPPLSIPNTAQIPVVVRVFGRRGRRIYKKGSYLIYKVLLRAAKYIRTGPLLVTPYFKIFFEAKNGSLGYSLY